MLTRHPAHIFLQMMLYRRVQDTSRSGMLFSTTKDHSLSFLMRNMQACTHGVYGSVNVTATPYDVRLFPILFTVQSSFILNDM